MLRQRRSVGWLPPLAAMVALMIYMLTREIEWLIWVLFAQNMWIIDGQGRTS